MSDAIANGLSASKAAMLKRYNPHSSSKEICVGIFPEFDTGSRTSASTSDEQPPVVADILKMMSTDVICDATA